MSTHLSKVPTPWVFEDYFLRSEVIRETEQCHIVKIYGDNMKKTKSHF